MLARWMKDWKAVCKLASAPSLHAHVGILCGRLGLFQDSRAVWDGAGAGPDQMQMQRIFRIICQTQHHAGLMKEA